MEAAYLAVARFRKAHGLKGDALFWVLTDEPDEVFAVGRKLTPIDEAGHAVGEPLEIERERAYHRNWLIKFREVAGRGVLEEWDQVLLGVPEDELTPPREDELYEHEIAGVAVAVQGTTVGTVRSLLDVPGGKVLSVNVDGREVLIPFRKPIVVAVSRTDRRIDIDPPAGLMDV